MEPICKTTEQLISFMQELKDGGIVTITSKTEVRMRKTNNPYVGAVKIQAVKVLIGADYEKEVNDQRFFEKKDETFTAEGLKWGESKDGVVVEHNGQQYIKTVLVEKDAQPFFMFNGRVISYDLLQPFVPEYKPSPKQQLENDIKVRTFKVESIVSVLVHEQLVYDQQLTK